MSRDHGHPDYYTLRNRDVMNHRDNVTRRSLLASIEGVDALQVAELTDEAYGLILTFLEEGGDPSVAENALRRFSKESIKLFRQELEFPTRKVVQRLLTKK
jgi:hypothetical protein